MSGAIADHQLMSEKQGLRGEGTGATRTKQFRQGDKRMNGEDQQLAHERTLPRLLPDARLPGTGGFRHTTISPSTRFAGHPKVRSAEPDTRQFREPDVRHDGPAIGLRVTTIYAR